MPFPGMEPVTEFLVQAIFALIVLHLIIRVPWSKLNGKRSVLTALRTPVELTIAGIYFQVFLTLGIFLIALGVPFLPFIGLKEYFPQPLIDMGVVFFCIGVILFAISGFVFAPSAFVAKNSAKS